MGLGIGLMLGFWCGWTFPNNYVQRAGAGRQTPPIGSSVSSLSLSHICCHYIFTCSCVFPNDAVAFRSITYRLGFVKIARMKLIIIIILKTSAWVENDKQLMTLLLFRFKL